MDQQPQEVVKNNTTRCPACGCVGMKLDAKDLLTKDQVAQEMKTLKLTDWRLSDDGRRLSRHFKCRNFMGCVDFINKAAVICERDDISHHADFLLVKYREMEVACYTHATQGLTAADFALARALEDIEIDYSPSWLKAHGFEGHDVKTVFRVPA